MGISSCCFQTKKAHRVTDDLKSVNYPQTKDLWALDVE